MEVASIMAGAQILSGIFGRKSKRKAARRGYGWAKRRIERQTDWAQEDLLRGLLELEGQIVGAVGATGMRGGSAQIGSVLDEERRKYSIRQARILEGEKVAIQGAAIDKKSAYTSANIGLAGDFIDAGSSYFSNPNRKYFK